MRKTLVPIGNSLGVIIEKPILELLNIGRETPLELSTDGRRLIIEPVEALATHTRPVRSTQGPSSPVPDYTDPRTTVRLLDRLVNEFQMDNGRFQRLHHARNYEVTIQDHRRYAENGPSKYQAGGTNAATAERLNECLAALEAGHVWDAAIELATRAVARR